MLTRSYIYIYCSAGFKRVKGDLNKGNRSGAHSVFLWYWKDDFGYENERGRARERIGSFSGSTTGGRRGISKQLEEEDITAHVREALRRRSHRRASVEGTKGKDIV